MRNHFLPFPRIESAWKTYYQLPYLKRHHHRWQIKKKPNFHKSCPKRSHRSFYFKSDQVLFQSCPNWSHWNQGSLWKRLLDFCSWCYKTFFGGNLDFPKIKKLKKVCSDVCTYLHKNVKTVLFSSKTIVFTCFFAFKMAYSCGFGLRGNLDFWDFLRKSFITSATV